MLGILLMEIQFEIVCQGRWTGVNPHRPSSFIILYDFHVALSWFRSTVASQAMGAIVAYVEEKLALTHICIVPEALWI
jgi:hypothetical protein